MIALTETGEPLRAEDINRFEQDFRVKLPDDFKEFLKRNDGGRPVLDTIDVDGFDESPTDVQFLYGINDSVETCTLRWNVEWIQGLNLNWKLLPFACDSFGSQFCFDQTDSQRTRIVFLDWNQEEPRIYPVAGSFTEFFSKLREWRNA